MKIVETAQDKEKLQELLAKLSSGVVVTNVDAATETKRTDRKRNKR